MKKFLFLSDTQWGIILLVTLIFTIFILPVMPLTWQEQSSMIVYTILYFSAIFSMDKKVKSILVLSIIAFCMNWLAGIFSLWILTSVSKLLSVIFFLIIIIMLIRQVATAPQVNLKVILGSVMGYLLMGLVYSIFVAYIMDQDPSSFNIPQSYDKKTTAIAHLDESVYFSFVSLATLGYGDILPLKPYTRSFAIWITVSGQLYIAIIVALLVGKFASLNIPVKPK